MFPIRDHNPSRRLPIVTYALIAANIVIFLSYVPIMNDEGAIGALLKSWALVPGEVTSGGSLHTFVSSLFLHASWIHLAGNMLFLWVFGDNLEDAFGHFGFLAFYLATGILASLVHVLAAPMSAIPTVGASGAIAGVLGGYLLLYPKARVDVLVILFFFARVYALPAWAMLGIWFAFQLLNGLTADMTEGGVAYAAHAGGFVFGLLFTLPIWLKKGATSFWERTAYAPPHPETQYPERISPIPKVRRRR